MERELHLSLLKFPYLQGSGGATGSEFRARYEYINARLHVFLFYHTARTCSKLERQLYNSSSIYLSICNIHGYKCYTLDEP